MSPIEIRRATPPLDAAIAVAASAFGLSIPPAGYEVNIAEKLASPYVFTAWEAETERPLGFAAFDFIGHLSVRDRPVAYLHAIAIADWAQTAGVGAALIEAFTRMLARPFALTLRTQSPIMMQLVASRARGIFPSPSREEIPAAIRVAGEESARITGSHVPRDPGSYGRPLYPDLPVHRDPRYSGGSMKSAPIA